MLNTFPTVFPQKSPPVVREAPSRLTSEGDGLQGTDSATLDMDLLLALLWRLSELTFCGLRDLLRPRGVLAGFLPLPGVAGLILIRGGVRGGVLYSLFIS